MEWNQIEGKWKQLRGQVKARWGKLTDDDIDRIQGRREELSGVLQQRYGYEKDRADQEAEEFARSLAA